MYSVAKFVREKFQSTRTKISVRKSQKGRKRKQVEIKKIRAKRGKEKKPWGERKNKRDRRKTLKEQIFSFINIF